MNKLKGNVFKRVESGRNKVKIAYHIHKYFELSELVKMYHKIRPSMLQLPYLPADRPHFFPRKMGPKLGLWPIRRYKRFDTSLICKRSHGHTLNWRFNVRFRLLLTYNTYN